MIRFLSGTLALALVHSPAHAEGPAAPTKPPPYVQALGQMVQECQGREALALSQGYDLSAQMEALKTRLVAETARADRAEASLKAAEKPAQPAQPTEPPKP